ncbi:sulfur carrier protein ThiS [Desulfosarcina sp.]|uniref:sulfur carrier protein ThiS n=1 Tax=Desulfosarcina sp. TaxID=2027861 RepID=UPI0029B43C8D|nr:sulfur carrier protein ThiS [Desulfosarcina sp.]MDX2453605.1 sulfur carrier protein ThiS [Desulfosarcina sp.]MDX2491312.1 sulfur carrier protein ThiS [Desulfosarcina sp.]
MVTVDEQARCWQEGLTVATLLAQLDDGHIYAVVKLDGKLVSRPHFDNTPVPDGARVTLIPMIAGG